MQFNRQFTDNLFLHYAETQTSDDDNRSLSVLFSFTFYGEHFTCVITRRYIEKNWQGCTAEGCAELFDSFTDQITTTHWETLVECWHEQDAYYEELMTS